jgi:hypothetical protein
MLPLLLKSSCGQNLQEILELHPCESSVVLMELLAPNLPMSRLQVVSQKQQNKLVVVSLD